MEIDTLEQEAKDAVDNIFNGSDGARVSDLREALERVKVHINECLADLA